MVWVSFHLPSIKTLKTYRPALGTEVFGSDFIKIGEFYRERRVFLPLDRIPQKMIEAVLAGEDAQFFSHQGVSFAGIFRAAIKNVLSGSVKQGGSTITQQVAKALLLSPERSFSRKIKELLLAFKMERYLTKEEILQIYLNQIYLGNGAYGVEAAAQVYFGKSIDGLDVSQYALIAGLTRAPSRDNPVSHPEKALQKRNYVLERMREEKYISSKECKAALEAKIVLGSPQNVNERYAPYFIEHIRKYLVSKYGDDVVLEEGLQVYTSIDSRLALASKTTMEQGIEEIDRHQGYRGPLERIDEKNFTSKSAELKKNNPQFFSKTGLYQALVKETSPKSATLDLGFTSATLTLKNMEWARKPNPDTYWEYNKLSSVASALKKGDLILVKPKGNDFILAQKPRVQGALISLDPKNGAIRSMVGGYRFDESEFNRSVQAKRQPGSSFKPIIYSAALDRGYTPAKVIVDAPVVFDDPTIDSEWKPKNYAGEFKGDLIFRDCLVESHNIPTIKILQDIGVGYVTAYAKKMGITSPLDANLSLSLGTSSVAPIEMARAYSVFASGGKKPKSEWMITKIVDRQGRVLERNTTEDLASNFLEQIVAAEKQFEQELDDEKSETLGLTPEATLPDSYAISPQTAYIMVHLLKQVITSGTGSRARDINRPAAGKTGTTNDNVDAWFVGFTPDLVTAVWFGFDDMTQRLGTLEDGGRIASPVWLNFMKSALEHIPESDFRQPTGLVSVAIDRKTGTLASETTKEKITEFFLSGTEPTTTTRSTTNSSENFYLDE